MRTIYLGVGAQKAGTTWLFRQFFHSDNFIPGLVKEYHLFDAQYLGQNSNYQNNITRRVRNFNKALDEATIQKNSDILKGFYEDEENYFNYFDSILKTETDFSADISPSYSGLPKVAFEKIKTKFNQRGISVKVIFLMREPITRLESSVKMSLRRSNCLHKTSQVEMIKKMAAELNAQRKVLRDDYSFTCQQLDQVFPGEDIFYGFYETMFSERELRRLGLFLNMEPKDFDASKVINSSAKLFKYRQKDINALRENVDDRYQFVKQKFNFDLAIWDEARFNMVDHGYGRWFWIPTFKTMVRRVLNR